MIQIRKAVPVLAGAVILGMVATFLIAVSSRPANRAAEHDTSSALLRWQLTRRDQSLLYNAQQIAFRTCLRAHGFKYWPIPQSQPPAWQLYPYVIDNVAWATRHGFGIDRQPDLTPLTSQDPNARYIRSLPASRQKTLALVENGGGPGTPGVIARLPTGGEIGHSRYGCMATADKRLYGSFTAWFQVSNIVDSLPALWQAKVVGDARFEVSVSRWARCMRIMHEAYANPMAAMQAFASPAGRGSRDAEIKAAVAEARCAGSSGLAALARKLNDHYRSLVMRKYQADIAAYRRLTLTAVSRARTLMRSVGRS